MVCFTVYHIALIARFKSYFHIFVILSHKTEITVSLLIYFLNALYLIKMLTVNRVGLW